VTDKTSSCQWWNKTKMESVKQIYAFHFRVVQFSSFQLNKRFCNLVNARPYLRLSILESATCKFFGAWFLLIHFANSEKLEHKDPLFSNLRLSILESPTCKFFGAWFLLIHFANSEKLEHKDPLFSNLQWNFTTLCTAFHMIMIPAFNALQKTTEQNS